MTQSVAMNCFARNVRHLLSETGMTQVELAELAGIHHPNVNRILNGKEGITIERAERIASALGVKLSELVSEKLPKKSRTAIAAV